MNDMNVPPPSYEDITCIPTAPNQTNQPIRNAFLPYPASPNDELMPMPRPVQMQMPMPQPVQMPMPMPQPVQMPMPMPRPVQMPMPMPQPVQIPMPMPTQMESFTSRPLGSNQANKPTLETTNYLLPQLSRENIIKTYGYILLILIGLGFVCFIMVKLAPVGKISAPGT